MSETPYLTVEEAATLARCHPRTIRRAIKAGHLHRIGATARVLLREDEVRAWVESGPAEPLERPRPRPRARSRHVAAGSVSVLRDMDPELRR